MTIGEKIKRRRIELRMTQTELANRIGYRNCASVNFIESGERELPVPKVAAVCEALGISPAYLLGVEEKDNRSFPTVHTDNFEQEILRVYSKLDFRRKLG